MSYKMNLSAGDDSSDFMSKIKKNSNSLALQQVEKMRLKPCNLIPLQRFLFPYFKTSKTTNFKSTTQTRNRKLIKTS